MATSPSPQQSPVMGGSHKNQRHHTNSPPPLSKRDKRRTMLADRLEDLTNQFSQNRDHHYREQLQAIQIDMNLILEADAHGKELLKNHPDKIEAMVRESMSAKRVIGTPPPRAGRLYAAFAVDVNDAMEERDAALIMHKRNFDVKVSELKATHAYHMRIASEEHKALSSTLRDRLMNSVISKKNRLSRDKETVEIGDSNAALLHPSQFGIANPASPGGVHGKRATRHRRDAEELTLAEGTKRKRRAIDDDESPAPFRQRLDNGNVTPLWQLERREMTATQIDSPLYSIEKLFTERELSMVHNTAATASHYYMQRHPPYDDENSPSNGKAESSTDAGTAEDGEDADPPLGGAMMERQYSHATRSTRAAAPFSTGLGVDLITDLNYPGSLEAISKQNPRLPPLLATVMQRSWTKNENTNSTMGLAPEDAAADFELMAQGMLYNKHHGKGRNLDLENGGRALLEAVSAPRSGPQYYTKSDS
ncbi:Sds3-like-domain-containing protein [Calycina marina]|uniref:Sds3-like-domain-containing protein n=1 Tax=Calycina marina TaxID=1763456 RepID=A0A9P7Z0V9_9HELO|nr:Sds3-like-domain-containing protein [Calycina marina]